ncbi:MAG: ankyrin repeat domain-containing protein [Sphaerochaetaceae bacterium]|jgi:hypothetical protein|nr:ankyrin repeat domain-containing protein [Sphaerochaetaceae bacterium]
MDYYKILNEKEYHHGLQYKFGLNVDPKEFNPSGDCSPGGIYFSREDIFAFIHYGPWIRKITLPKDAQVYENPGGPKKWKADRIILGKKEKITAKVIKRLIDEGADPNVDNSWILVWAAKCKYLEIVKLIIPYINSKIAFNQALNTAAKNGQLKIVKLLIPHSEIDDSEALTYSIMNGHFKISKLLIPYSNLKANNSEALRFAAEVGSLEIVKLLIPHSNPKSLNSHALSLAAKNGHLEIVKLLLPYSNPKSDSSKALLRAAKNGHLEIVKLLIPHSEINNYVFDCCKIHCDDPEIFDLIKANKK